MSTQLDTDIKSLASKIARSKRGRADIASRYLYNDHENTALLVLRSTIRPPARLRLPDHIAALLNDHFTNPGANRRDLIMLISDQATLDFQALEKHVACKLQALVGGQQP